MSLLDRTNLRKTYRMSRRTSVNALRGGNVKIAAGEMVAIMGPSGSGKSTLMHLLGLLHAPDRNDDPAPELWFDGTDAGSLSDRDRTLIRARSMGFVLGLLRRFNRERGQTVLLVTHDAEVGAACDRIVRMRDGLVLRDQMPRVTSRPQTTSRPINDVKKHAALRAPNSGQWPAPRVAEVS